MEGLEGWKLIQTTPESRRIMFDVYYLLAGARERYALILAMDLINKWEIGLYFRLHELSRHVAQFMYEDPEMHQIKYTHSPWGKEGTMNEMQMIYLLYGMMVREYFTDHHTMDGIDQERLWSFSYRQVQMYNDGIRDSRMHDTTLVLMENVKRL